MREPTAVQQRESGAQHGRRRHSQRLRQQCHRHHSRHRRLRLRRPWRRRHPLLPRALSIHSTVQSVPRTRGQRTKKGGAAEFITEDALRLFLRQRQFRFRSSLQIHSIALLVSRTGRPVGRWPKRSGVAGSMAKVAITAVADASQSFQHLHRLIAMQDSQIGWQDGLWLKRLGVAPMQVRGARQLRAVVHERRPCESEGQLRQSACLTSSLALVPSSDVEGGFEVFSSHLSGQPSKMAVPRLRLPRSGEALDDCVCCAVSA